MSLVAAPLAGSSSRADLARPNADRRTAVASVACVGVCALVLLAPFEALDPLLTLPGQSLSTVEAAIVVALGGWMLATIAMRVVPIWRSPLTLPWLSVLVAMSVAAVAAPEHGANAWNMVGRGVFAFLIYLLALNAVASERYFLAVMVAATVSGLFVWPFVLFEYAQVTPVTRLLSHFRAFSANVGGALRASGPFQYPTIASMYLEIVFCLALGLFLFSVDRRKHGLSILIGIAIVALGQAISLTSSRAGLAVMLLAFSIVGLARLRRGRFDAGTQGLVAIAVLIGIQFPTTSAFQNLGLRLTTEGQSAWYSVSFDVPIEVTMPTEAVVSVPVRVTNTGLTVWNSATTPPFRLSYHLLLDDNRVLSWQGLRTDFPRPVHPGEAMTLSASVEAPARPGRYRIMWDIEREGWLWFSTEPGAPMFVTNAVVTGPDIGPVGVPYETKLPASPSRPGRPLLWRAGLGIFFAHPLSGVGPDNYRLTYGPYAGLVNFDTRIHSNNMYLEILSGSGLIGAAAFGWLCCGIGVLSVAALRNRRLPATGMAVAIAMGAIAIHGVVDSFLGFTPTYVLYSVTAGLLAGLPVVVRNDAHRI